MSETRPTPPPPDGVVGVFERLAVEVAAWATDPTGPSGTVLGGILARHGLVNVAEVERLREQVAERDERLARMSLDAILAAGQTGTPDPRPAGPFADPEREARAQAWDEQVERVAEAIAGVEADYDPHGRDWRRHIAAAAIKAIEAERAGEAEVEIAYDWGCAGAYRSPVGPMPEADARRIVASAKREGIAILIRRTKAVPAGPWEAVEAESEYRVRPAGDCVAEGGA